MEPFFKFYLAAWVTACVTALALVWRNPASFTITGRAYRRFLFVPWKLATFAVAAVGLTVVAPWTGDPTWDYVDAAFMSVLTFLTAPWVVGVLYLAARRKLPLVQLYVAFCLWMFSASWSYDLYLLLRDGKYTELWFVNIFASSILYLSAGLLWNLDWRKGRGATFAFQEKNWLVPSSGFNRIFWYAMPFMLIAALSVLYFLV
jgi:hypothetical protein